MNVNLKIYIKSVLVTAVFLISCLFNFSSQAAKVENVQSSTWNAVQENFKLENGPVSLIAAEALNEQNANALLLIKSHKDKKHIVHERMRQMYAGFPVFGGSLIVHRSILQKSPPSMNGLLYHNLWQDLGRPPLNFVQNAHKALAAIEASYSDKYSIVDKELQPLVYVDAKNKAHWSYQISLLMRKPDGLLLNPSRIIDAFSFKPYLQWNNLKTITPVKGFGYGGNKKIGMQTYNGETLPLLDLTQTRASRNKPATCYMENKDVKVIDLNHTYTYRTTPMHFACKPVDGLDNSFWTGYEGDGLDEENGNFSSTNDVLYAGYIIKHMYRDWYKVEVLKNKDGSPMQLVLAVHYGKNYTNARWYKDSVIFGEGSFLTYPPVSIDIAAHEVSHGFTERNAGLIHYGQSGAMDEAFSDMAGEVAEYYAKNKNDWMIGAEIMKEDSDYKALRYMDIPSKDGHSIERAVDYPGDFIDTHYAAGVFNRLFYLMATHQYWDIRKAFAVMVKANMDYWTELSSFEEGACGILKAARDLGYEIEDVKSSLDKVLIDYQKCKLTDLV